MENRRRNYLPVIIIVTSFHIITMYIMKILLVDSYQSVDVLRDNYSLEGRQFEPSAFGLYNLTPVSNVDCLALFRNDSHAIQMVRQQNANSSGLGLPNGTFIDAQHDCGGFIKKFGFITKPVTREEAAFAISFSILAYKDVEQTVRLLRAIYRPQNVYCLHVDNSTPDGVKRGLSSVASCFPNVDMASHLVDVEWGQWSLVEAELVCMRDHLRYPNWTYHINLAAQEFPLKTNLELVRILKAVNGSNVMLGDLNIPKGIRRRFLYMFKNKKAVRMRTEEELKPPFGIQYAKGSFFHTVTREFVEYVTQSEVARQFAEWVKPMKIPDETYFVALNFNPHLRAPGSYQGSGKGSIPINRFVIWKDDDHAEEATKCYGHYVHHVCILSSASLFQLYDRPELFANKFHLDEDPVAYSCMEELIRNRTVNEMKTGDVRPEFNISIYKNFDFARNHA